MTVEHCRHPRSLANPSTKASRANPASGGTPYDIHEAGSLSRAIIAFSAACTLSAPGPKPLARPPSWITRASSGLAAPAARRNRRCRARQQHAGAAGGDRGIARRSGQQGELTEEVSGAQMQRLRPQLDRDLALGDEIHAVARFAAARTMTERWPDSRGARSRPCATSAISVAPRNCEETAPWRPVPRCAETPAAAHLLGIAGGENAGEERKHHDAAHHDDARPASARRPVTRTSPSPWPGGRGRR